MTIASASMNVAGVELSVCSAGEGQPLLFLHSGPGPTYDSAPFLRLLGSDFRVSAPYHPGFGPQSRPQSFETVDDVVYFYLDFVKEQGLAGVPVVAASFGGWIAAEMAIRDPSLFSHMVLINPLGIRVGGPTERPIADLWAMSRDDRRRLQFHNEAWQVEDLSARSDEHLLELARFEETLARYAWKPFLHNPHLPKWLRRIDLPTLVIRGEEDRFVSPEIHAAFAEMIPNASFQPVPNAGHHPHVEEPHVVASLIREFLRRPESLQLRRK